MTDASHYDVVIIGGGMVGATMAYALNDQSLRIALVEAVPFQSDSQPSYDERSIALAYGSRRIFDGLGLWSDMAGRVTPITNIHISDRGRFGATRLSARDEGVEALGYVVENRVVGAALLPRLDKQTNLDIHCPARVEKLHIDDNAAYITITGEQGPRDLSAALVIAADGGKSLVRQQLGVATTLWQYGQTAVIATVSPGRPHNGVAYERFTDSGPIALLPMSEGRCSLVMTVSDRDVDQVTALDDAAFLERLQQRFGNRLGRFQRVGPRHAYPLALIRAKQHIRPRLALIGNAAHTLHPIAGQGFNLGIRDVAALAEVIAEAVEQGDNLGDLAVLKRYAQWRERDHVRVMAFTDGLARIFSNPLPPVAVARDLGLTALDVLPGAKRLLCQYTMGLAGRLPRLARGLPLS